MSKGNAIGSTHIGGGELGKGERACGVFGGGRSCVWFWYKHAGACYRRAASSGSKLTCMGTILGERRKMYRRTWAKSTYSCIPRLLVMFAIIAQITCFSLWRVIPRAARRNRSRRGINHIDQVRLVTNLALKPNLPFLVLGGWALTSSGPVRRARRAKKLVTYSGTNQFSHTV
ncbi:hypothetical protein EDB19DRAFT_1804799, partial [Suillus lakei]